VDPGGLLDHLRYPVGRFVAPAEVSPEQRDLFIQQIAEAPANVRHALGALTPMQLDTPYRPGGWTARQVVHHLADSHLNSYLRFRLTLTEEEPTIKPYHEDRWAELPDSRNAPPEVSLSLLAALHERWVMMLRALREEEWKRSFRHPELGVMRLDLNLALYAWHCRHHVGHIRSIPERSASDQ
jgi:hypothetical protein